MRHSASARVRGRGSETGYDRAQFGPAWLDIAANGCDTRDDVLAGVDVDHVVALGDAWQKAAQQLDLQARAALANDPLNLVPTQARLNRQKARGTRRRGCRPRAATAVGTWPGRSR